MDKQIEEIKQLARDIFDPKTAIDGIDLAFAAVHGADRDDTHFMRIATHLYGKGYRRASEVAKEVIDNILSKIRTMIREIEKVERNGNSYFSEFNGGSKTALEIVSKDIAELKKKYESEGNK